MSQDQKDQAGSNKRKQQRKPAGPHKGKIDRIVSQPSNLLIDSGSVCTSYLKRKRVLKRTR